MNRGKLIAAGILMVLLLVIIAQNVQLVRTDFLFWTLTLPQALLLFLTGTIGFALGVLISFFLARRKKPPIDDRA